MRKLLCSVHWRTGMRKWSVGIEHCGLQVFCQVSSSLKWIKEPPLVGQDVQLVARPCVSPCDRLLPRCSFALGIGLQRWQTPAQGCARSSHRPLYSGLPLIVIRAKGLRAAAMA